MTKKIDQEEIDAILKAILSMGGRAALKQIRETLEISIHPRTLQRRLKVLVDEGRLTTHGNTRSKKYQLQSPLIENPLPSIAVQRSSIPLSVVSIEIQRWVNQPIQLRPYVNYKRKFLDDYQPNVTRYLPESVSQHLLNLGKTDGDRPAGTFARQIFNRLLIDLSWNSSRLEGNTYSLLETERLIEFDEMTEGKDLAETQMIRNHKAAIRFLIESVDSVGINRYTVLNLHALLSKNLLGNPESCGRLRNIPVGIAKTVYLPAAIPHLIEECFLTILEKGRSISNPFEQAFFLMVHLPYLQPFEDVNKRVSRLAVNIPLIRDNLCPLSFVDVPKDLYISGLLGVYELNRIDLFRDIFVWAYERSCLLYSTTRKTLGEPDPFRMKYEKLIFDVVTQVVVGCLDKTAAIALIKQKANSLKSIEEQERFIQTVEIELRGLHDGNIACYQLRPIDYETWHKIW